MIVLNSLFPVFILVILGVLLKQRGFTNAAFLRQSDGLIYYIFFPVMLFWKIGGASHSGTVDWTFLASTLIVILLMFVISILVIRTVPVGDFQAGSFSQSCYRFNTYIGVAIILTSLGERGVTIFGILISLVIPIINVFAVSILIWFSGEKLKTSRRLRLLVKALAANPLILGCLAGIIYSRTIGTFPVFIDNSLRMMSMVTLPMALISIGGSLTFSGVRKYLANSFLAAFLKLLILPVMGYAAYSCTGVDGVEFKVGMIFFCLPASTAIYVLSSQMNSDTELASSAIVLSTVMSAASLTVALLL